MEYTGTLKRVDASAITLLRHTLLAFGEEPPAEPSRLFEKIAAMTGADAGAFQDAHAFREGLELEKDSFTVYDEYLRALEKVILALDGTVPKKEWQRVSK